MLLRHSVLASTVATVLMSASVSSFSAQNQQDLQDRATKITPHPIVVTAGSPQEHATTQDDKAVTHKGKFPRKTRRFDKGLVRIVGGDQPYFESLPSTTFDLALLKQRNKYPIGGLDLGGYMELDSQYWRSGSNLVTGESGEALSKQGTGTYLSTLDLDMMSNILDYVTAFVKTEESGLGTSDEKMVIRKALVTFGNLDKTPIFMTVGKSYLPFGVFGGGGPWSAALTRSAFRPSEVPQILVGYYKNGLNTNIAVYNSHASESQIKDYVYSVYYTHQVKKGYGVTVGAAYLNDMRGLPSGLGSAYASTGVLTQNKRVPVYDLNAELDLKQFSFTAEWLTALRQGTYNSNATTSGQTVVSNGQTQGRPAAWELGSAFTSPLYGKAMTYSLSYQKTYHMAGIPMGLAAQAVPGPSALNGLEDQWIAGISREFAKNIIGGLEYQRAKTYANKSGWTITADLSIYF